MQSYTTIQHDNNILVFYYDDMNNKNYNEWTKLFNNENITFNITNNIMLISDSNNVTFINDTEIVTITLEECQQTFREYYNNLSYYNVQELLKNSCC